MQQAVQLHRTGQLQQARALYENCLQLVPGHADALYYLGYLHHQAGNDEAAEPFLMQAVKAAPKNKAFLMGLAQVQERLDKLSRAAATYAKAIMLDPPMAEAHNNYGVVLRDLGNIDAAIDQYRMAIALKPDYTEAYYNIGTAFADQGDVVSAEHAYRTALQHRPDYANALRNLVELGLPLSQLSQEIEQVQKLMFSPRTSNADMTALCFTMGKLMHRASEFDQAFKYFEKGNKLKRSTITFNIHDTTDYVSRCIDFFTSEYIDSFAATGNPSEQPVFIVGMPRSGTTLVEQILSSHPDVHAAGELLYIKDIRQQINDLTNKLVFPESLLSLEPGKLTELADQYITAINRLDGSNSTIRVTDKMPTNFLYLGLIASLLPRAIFIHCVRNPADTCLSNYMQLYSRGNEFSYQLDELADYYIEYRRLMQHWQNIMPNKILDVHYEKLVTEPKAIINTMLDCIGLDWNDNCLAFHTQQRAVQTASNWQVRQPLYHSSINRWKDYRDQLAPLINRLQPLPQAN